MPKATISQPAISRPIVSTNCAARLNDSPHKGCQAGTRCVFHVNKTNASYPLFALIFDCDANQRLTCRTTPAFARLLAANIGFINFDDSTQLVPPGPHHCSPQFMQPLPSCVVTTEVQNPLQPKGICSVLLTSNVPHSSKPKNQWFTSTMKNRTGSHRTLNSALLAMIQISVRLPSVSTPTVGTNKSVGPPQLMQVIDAPAFGAESLFKFHQCLWVVVVHETNITRSHHWSQVHTPVVEFILPTLPILNRLDLASKRQQ